MPNGAVDPRDLLKAGARAAAVAPREDLGVRNIVLSVKAGSVFDLVDLAARIPGAEYSKRGFPGLILHISRPKCAALAFSNGKLIVTGLDNVDTIAPSLSAVLEVLRTAGATIEDDPPARVVNMVLSGSLGAVVALLQVVIATNLERVEYEPETFPGLIYRSETGPVVLVFASGALVVSGAMSVDQAQAAAAEVRHMIDTAGAWGSNPRPRPGPSDFLHTHKKSGAEDRMSRSAGPPG